MPRNKMKPLKKLKKVEKDQDQKLLFQVKEATREIKEELRKILYLDQNPMEKNILMSRLQKGHRDHLLAEVHLQAKIRMKAKIAKIRTTRSFLGKK